MRKIAMILVAVGVLLLIYPQWNEWMADREQEKLLKEALLLMDTPEPVNTGAAQSYAQLNDMLNEGEESEDEAASLLNDFQNGKPIATIKIERIDVLLPILDGATKANMKHAAVHMRETAIFGEEGNAAVAAHRAHTTGRLFNRLNEVEIGDEIVVQTSTAKYIYKVYETLIVEPTELSVLDSVPGDKLLTLITCDPLINPTHRLIVHARQMEML
ncbi:sortase A [Paenibacillus algorifonticola]|uniref:Sortase A n=1 Tax=Paenibacillus algorifonticola TaxID=684063 RepID=A0A1I2HGF2_9BACL|nr:class D sortase [Paenibacillus algorifonticola]SFF28618.1 sortase A [Paenibacillus algorifonticola]